MIRTMDYRLHRNADPCSEMQRVLLEQNRSAQQLLEMWEEDPAGHVHEARLCFKRIRAALSTLRPRFGYVYAVENRAYRDLARMLSYARDTSAMVEAANLLLERSGDTGLTQGLLILRNSLEVRAARETTAALAGMGGSVDTVRAELPMLADRLECLPLKALRWKHVRTGVRSTVRRAQRNFLRLDPSAGPEQYHDWRKQVKLAYFQASLMSELMPRWSARNRTTLHDLGRLLGDAQDLNVLSALIAAAPGDLGIDSHARELLQMAGHVQTMLQSQAAGLGQTLFACSDMSYMENGRNTSVERHGSI